MKLILSIILLIVCVFFEEPRITSLLSLVFPGEFPILFSFLLPLILVLSLVLMDTKHKYTRLLLSSLFSVLLILSYYNTVLSSVNESRQVHKDKIDLLYISKSEKQNILMLKHEPRQCFYPSIGMDNFDKLLNNYKYCQNLQTQEKLDHSKNMEIIQSQINDLDNQINKLQSEGVDWFLVVAQSVSGLILSVILGIASGVSSTIISIETRDFIQNYMLKKFDPIKYHILEGKTYREISKQMGISISTVHSHVKRQKRFNRKNNTEQTQNKNEQSINNNKTTILSTVLRMGGK